MKSPILTVLIQDVSYYIKYRPPAQGAAAGMSKKKVINKFLFFTIS